MSHLDNSGSDEDGQLRSPGDDNYLSEGEQCDTADSLDIKPPQATKRESGRKKSSKKDKHSREHKHKERDRDRERIPRERDKDGSRGEERRHRHSGFRRDRDRHNHRREYYEQQHQRDYEYHNRQKQREREKRMEQGPRDRDRRKYNMDQQYESNADAEKALEDLRSRLLSKRHKYQKEIARYEDQGHYESISPKRRSSGQEYRKEYKERKENIIEVIDSPEHYSDYGSGKRKDKKAPIPEDPEQAYRRAKLLEAEREMARRKEVAREELEARRSRREREEPVSPPEQVKPKLVKKRYPEEQSHVSSRKRTKNSLAEDNEYEDKVVQNISDDSEISSDDEKEGATGSESESSTESDISKNEKSGEEDDALPGSPLSVGDLSKSDHRHNTSKSRSTSVEIRSRSNSERSKRSNSSKSKSRFPSRSGSEIFASKSRSQSRSRSGSRDRSRSHSVSRSRSRSHSNSGSDSDEKDEIKISKAELPEDNNDEEMKNSDEISKEVEEEAQTSPKLDESPRDENGEKLPNYFPGIQGCRSVEEFQCLNRIEEGTYGVVYRAKDKRTNEIVALKRLKMEKEKEGFPITSLREINTLLKGQHPNIVTVREIVVGSNMDKIFIVMDYVEHDLKSLMETMKHKDQAFFPGEVKCLLQQLLRAVAHLHDNWILHRDLKTSNLLLSHKGILKVGDFGLAREYGSPLKAYTSLVVTLWYRAPELLLCAKEYSTPIDMWSVGCIFAEFLQMGPLFPGKSEIDQLNRIFKELGTPNEKIWPGYKDLPAVQNLLSQNSHFTEYPVSNLRRRFFNKTTEVGISLLQGLLTYDPKQRLTAELALRNPYFKELPLPIDPSMFPTWPAKSELGARKALASSPKAPSGGTQFKQLGRDDITAANNSSATNKTGFVLNAGIDQRQLAMGPGFNLKF